MSTKVVVALKDDLKFLGNSQVLQHELVVEELMSLENPMR